MLHFFHSRIVIWHDVDEFLVKMLEKMLHNVVFEKFSLHFYVY